MVLAESEALCLSDSIENHTPIISKITMILNRFYQSKLVVIIVTTVTKGWGFPNGQLNDYIGGFFITVNKFKYNETAETAYMFCWFYFMNVSCDQPWLRR